MGSTPLDSALLENIRLALKIVRQRPLVHFGQSNSDKDKKDLK
jgi:hypothetical protein